MLVISALWPEAIEEYRSRRYASVAEVLVTPAVGDGGPDDPETRNFSLSRMREELVEQMNTLVAVGGKLHRDDRKRPGVVEEVELAVKRGMACFLVGGFGGMSGELAGRLSDPAILRNALTAEENDSLSRTHDVAACVQVVFGHLLRHPELARQSLAPLARRNDEPIEAGAQIKEELRQAERISLSRRALEGDPWQEAVERFPQGTRVSGRVARLESFGAFVELAPGLEGLVHVSELGAGRRVSHPREVVKPGQEVEVTVLGVDGQRRRISLSMAGEPAKAGAEEVREYSKESGSGFRSLRHFFKGRDRRS